MRSGALMAIHMPTIPPSESPHQCTRSDAEAVEQAQGVGAEVGERVWAGRDGRAAVAAVVVAHDAQALGQRGDLRVPHGVRAAQGVGEHEDGRVAGAADLVVDVDGCHERWRVRARARGR